MASMEKAPKEELFGPDGTAGAGRSARPTAPGATAGVGWALLSSALFSVTILLFVEAGALHPVALAAYGRLGTMLVLVPVALLLAGLRMPRALLRRSAYAGVFDAAAFVALASAISIGPVAIASVTCAQGGTMAAILGLVVLRERLSRVQIAGVALTCVAVALLATG